MTVRATASKIASDLPPLLGYLVTVRLLGAAVIVPGFALATSTLLESRAGGVVTNATAASFVASWQGVTYLPLVAALMLWVLLANWAGPSPWLRGSAPACPPGRTAG